MAHAERCHRCRGHLNGKWTSGTLLMRTLVENTGTITVISVRMLNYSSLSIGVATMMTTMFASLALVCRKQPHSRPLRGSWDGHGDKVKAVAADLLGK
jgi:hypothetical protein